MSSSLTVLAAAILLVSSVLPVIHAQCGVQCDTVTAWRNTLFNKVPTLPIESATSRLLTFKDTAYVVLVGDNKEGSIIALATLGTGRVAAVTIKHYVVNLGQGHQNSKIKLLRKNLIKWLKNGDAGTWNICNPSSSAELATCLSDPNVKTILWTGGIWPTDADENAVTAWVQQGNTLVHGFDKVEFESNTVESAKHIGFYSTLLAAGIAYCPHPSSVPAETKTADVQQLVNMNLQNVADSLTWYNFEANSQLAHVLNLVQDYPRYFLAEVSNYVLKPFESFATSMEVNMIWPVATPSNPNNLVGATARQHAMYNVYYTLSMAHLWRTKAPNVDLFPGDVTNPPATETAKFHFQSQDFRHFHSTGFYLAAGQEMTISINNSPADYTWQRFVIFIGIQTDDLTNKKSDLARFPHIHRGVKLVDRTMTIRWPFGGLVYARSPGQVNNNLPNSFLLMTITGVIPTPHLDIVYDQNLDATWSSRCQSAGLTADIHGEIVRFTVPADGGVCTLSGEELKQNILLWDEAMRKNYELRGDPLGKEKQQSFTVDLQLTKNFGFPIVGDIELGYINVGNFYFSFIWSDMWEQYYELGDNVNGRFWKYPQSIEAIPNIFAYFQMERMAGFTWQTLPQIQDNLASPATANWFANPSWTSSDYNAWVRFMVYSQVIRDFGWNCQRDVFKSFVDDKAQGNPLPKYTGAKIQEWVKRWSQAVGYNLCPLFRDFWLWPVDTATCNALAALPPYLPDDIITQRTDAASLTASVVSAWPNLVRTVSQPLPCAPFDIEPISPSL